MQMRQLADAVNHYMDSYGNGQSPFFTAVPGLILLRATQEHHPTHLIHSPALCVVIQGAKWTTFGNARYDYAAGEALLVSLDMPGFSQVAQGNPDTPYLSAVIGLDAGILSQVLAELEHPPTPPVDATPGAAVTRIEGPLADCTLRAMRLIDNPAAIPVLYPAIMKEICYWLLTGPHGSALARLALGSGNAPNVINAIHHLRHHFARAISVEELAAVAGLSASAFHRHFKALTAMSPLQYQKRMRLLQARKLMIVDAANAEEAAFQVGYESASQFSREYARMFGQPPRRDITALRTEARRVVEMAG
ncbi:AraC family transcriptional regulator [Silvimonas amylolytica]|uniref:AraC family transcriptional regulator n=1 Tax=Silvimonas amylolytica TaxID=449663 RepID=A0ABQ2PSE0_9NEIS|nr:AraC family transcriptional regulator [Silvimonas amylolytica]GGP28155.1 AraC family transcriptional regulator [Silvimonas amylolytica]